MTAVAGPAPPFRRPLEPNERIAEVLFGLIMVLTFTGSLSVATAGREDVRTMLIGALGCNMAWGMIDALFYLMSSLAGKGDDLATLRAVRGADQGQARQLITDALPPALASVLQPQELDDLHQRLQQLPEPPRHVRLHRDDWAGAVAVFLVVFLVTFPVAIPFIVMHDVTRAKRVSNLVAMGMMFFAGAGYARVIGRSPWAGGIWMVLLGGVLVGMTIALGG